MPDLLDLQRHFNEGKTHSLRALIQHFGCEPADVLQHLTRRNGFTERPGGKTTLWDFNPCLIDVAAMEAASNA